jgi:hypothetical protein
MAAGLSGVHGDLAGDRALGRGASRQDDDRPRAGLGLPGQLSRMGPDGRSGPEGLGGGFSRIRRAVVSDVGDLERVEIEVLDRRVGRAGEVVVDGCLASDPDEDGLRGGSLEAYLPDQALRNLRPDRDLTGGDRSRRGRVAVRVRHQVAGSVPLVDVGPDRDSGHGEHEQGEQADARATRDQPGPALPCRGIHGAPFGPRWCPAEDGPIGARRPAGAPASGGAANSRIAPQATKAR